MLGRHNAFNAPFKTTLSRARLRVEATLLRSRARLHMHASSSPNLSAARTRLRRAAFHSRRHLTTAAKGADSWIPRFLLKESIVAGPAFNRWLVPPAAICVHLCIGRSVVVSDGSTACDECTRVQNLRMHTFARMRTFDRMQLNHVLLYVSCACFTCHVHNSLSQSICVLLFYSSLLCVGGVYISLTRELGVARRHTACWSTCRLCPSLKSTPHSSCSVTR
jgi:hypothetical protein